MWIFLAQSRFYSAGLFVAAGCCIAVTGCSAGAVAVLLWGAPVLLCLAWELWRLQVLWRKSVPSERQRLRSRPGLANQITLLRGGLIALLAGFGALSAPLPLSLHWCMALLYSLAALADGLDGFVARRSGSASQLGAGLDTEFDAFGMLIAPLTAVLHSRLPAEYLLVSAAYYLYKLAAGLRLRRGLPVLPLPPCAQRRYLAGFQMGLVAIALFPVYSYAAVRVAAWAFMVPFLWRFMQDWLAVSGSPWGTSAGIPVRGRVGTGLLLRAFAAVLLLLCVHRGEMPLPVALTALFFLLPGIAVRSVAILLMLYAGTLLSSPAGQPALQILLFGCALLSLYGGGALAVWSPEERWLNR